MKILLSGILFFTILFTVHTNSHASVSVETSDKMMKTSQVHVKSPSFSLSSLNGKTYSTSDVSGPIVINFWASWCSPCKIEAPELVKLYDKYGGKVQIYAVNITSNDSKAAAQRFAELYGFKFPVLLDVNDTVSQKYKILAIPTTFFINKEGVIVDQIVGFGGEKILKEKFKKLAEDYDN
ncbi:TlpA family protein disulfide reductase [Peribacillus asahii]|uniref:TlpA family protein disulfide reductase n=1 Tax=Peribacillus asahii TaxID=228899 RepID=UPI00207ADAE6|nr:TlpA disulfide reductase family protein [Peribacillus asahii]USK62385.1 TlpA family protein disulfide reductase [Peribacillus asahii]